MVKVSHHLPNYYLRPLKNMYTNQNIIEGHSNLDKLTKPCHFEFEQPAGTYLLQVSESCLNFTQNVNKPEAPKD
jgi:hypothetical protein